MTAPWRPSGYADGADGDALKAKRAACAARGHLRETIGTPHGIKTHSVQMSTDYIHGQPQRCGFCGAGPSGPSAYDNTPIRVPPFYIREPVSAGPFIAAALLDLAYDTMIPPAMMGAAVHSHAEASHGNTIGQRGTESRTEGGASEGRAPVAGQPVADDRNEGLERVDGTARGPGGG